MPRPLSEQARIATRADFPASAGSYRQRVDGFADEVNRRRLILHSGPDGFRHLQDRRLEHLMRDALQLGFPGEGGRQGIAGEVNVGGETGQHSDRPFPLFVG